MDGTMFGWCDPSKRRAFDDKVLDATLAFRDRFGGDPPERVYVGGRQGCEELREVWIGAVEWRFVVEIDGRVPDNCVYIPLPRNER